jgi:hypothetical protein
MKLNLAGGSVIKFSYIFMALKNSISELNELCQFNNLSFKDKLISMTGPPHCPITVRLTITTYDGNSIEEDGVGSSKKEAKKDASLKLLKDHRLEKYKIAKEKGREVDDDTYIEFGRKFMKANKYKLFRNSLDVFKDSPVVAVDTEGKNEFGRPMIVQIADSKNVSILDYQSCRKEIKDMLMTKTVIFCSNSDIKLLGYEPILYRDIQAEDKRKFGLEKVRSLKTMAGEYFGEVFTKLSPNFYRSTTWSIDYIDNKHIIYAAFDAVVTFLIAMQ